MADTANRKDSIMIRVGLLCLLGIPSFVWSAAPVEDARVLLERYRCNICHAKEAPGTGPAFVDIADRFRHERGAVAKVAAIIKGGSRSGGPWHMPPHPEISNSRAVAMARHILSIRHEAGRSVSGPRGSVASAS